MSEGTATEIFMCGTKIKLGDMLTVEYTEGSWSKGSQLHGSVVELWDGKDGGPIQARLSNGWCFHDWDKIIKQG